MRLSVVFSSFVVVLLSFAVSGTLFAQYRSAYPDIPIVDVHIHASGVDDMVRYMEIRESIKERTGANLAFWVSLNDPGGSAADMRAAAGNRILFATNQRPHRGWTTTPEAVISKVKNDGFVGMKLWFGPHYRVLREGEEGITRIDDPRLASFFAALDRENILMASLHIADPNGPFADRQNWLKDPVYFWEQIRSFENIVAKYPNITFVAAHNAWLFCQDAQVDYLRYMFSTYPNLYADTSATLSYARLLDRDNVRDFYIEYQDRLLYGTDFLRITSMSVDAAVNMHISTFRYYETDQNVYGARGLELPREVLEKLYFKNALKLYPGLKEALILD